MFTITAHYPDSLIRVTFTRVTDAESYERSLESLGFVVVRTGVTVDAVKI